MFLGESRHALDPKGRLTVPARFRAELGNVVYATKGLDRCIFIYTMDEWKKLEEKIYALPFTKGDVRAFTRMFFSGASELEMDKQGRVLLPASLIEYAGIDKEIMIMGVGARIELWSIDNWSAYEKEATRSFEEITENLVNFGL